jgi:hypothetical protein
MQSILAFIACVGLCVGSAQLKLSPTAVKLSLTTAFAQAPVLFPRDTVAPPAVGTARITGRIVAADTGNPIARAQVQISSPALPKERQAMTDAGGRYEITGLPAGRYKLFVARLGFVTIEYGQSRPLEPGRDLELFDGQTVDGVDFALSRGGVITGRVTDQHGEPQPGLAMNAMRFSWGPNGTRSLERSSGGFFGGIITDDLGQFRIYGLVPGSYVVAAAMVPGIFIGPRPAPEGLTYYPGTANVDEAQPVDVEMGREAVVHFSLVNTRLARVTGTIVDSDGRPLAWRSVTLASRGDAGSAFRSAGTTRPDGTFEIPSVAPGHYTIEVSPLRTEPSDHQFVSFPISVDGHDVTDLLISAKHAATVSGRVIWEGTSPQPFATLHISVAAPDQQMAPARVSFGGSGTAAVDAKGRFTIVGVNGHVVFRTSFTGRAETWNLKAVKFGGADITDTGYHVIDDMDGIEVVLTDRETRVSGSARDARNQPVADYVVVFLPSEVKSGIDTRRFVQTARPDQQGRYQAKGLPPGEYVAAAFESLSRDGHYNPEFQKRMRAVAKPFRLKEGQELALDFALVP